jgi:hypothetical protein
VTADDLQRAKCDPDGYERARVWLEGLCGFQVAAWGISGNRVRVVRGVPLDRIHVEIGIVSAEEER